MKLRTLSLAPLLGVATFGAAQLLSSPAAACGGFFCSQSQPVNQAAERIIFSHNAEANTVTAVIQIMYEGPSENFSWMLPISSVPEGDELAVASDVAFQRLQQATNPQYNLTTRVEGQCREDFETLDAPTDDTAVSMGGSVGFDAAPEQPGGVSVASSGQVGAFEFAVLEFNPELEDPATAALDWLTENEYDILPGSADLIRPYLADGMYLLALRLTKGATSGSIRPIVLTYDADLPSIPIRLTAVAANENMGVMTWNLGQSRSVPFNYRSLELNEARINWFNAASNYGQVVNEAADEAGGEGFVTEFAGASETLADTVWFPWEEDDWNQVSTRTYSNFGEIFRQTLDRYSRWSGYWDAVQRTVTLPEGVNFEDFRACPECYADDVQMSPTAFFAAIEEDVIEPVRMVQRLIDDAPYVTRLYTTMSAEEMLVDPVFAFNPDLEDLSNIHTAERIIQCNPEVYQREAPWRIVTPQGHEIWGTPEDVGTWPPAVDDQPATFRISTLAATGAGTPVQENAMAIATDLDDYNQTVPVPVSSEPASPTGNQDRMTAMGMGDDVANPDPNTEGTIIRSRSNRGCSVSAPQGSRGSRGALLAGLAALGLVISRRRRR